MRKELTARLGRPWLFLLIIALGGCCTDLYEQNRVSRQDEAASVHVAVLSVTPWEEVRDALQPTFKMSADDALAQAVPTTMALEQKVLDAFAARLKLALPGTSFADTSTVRLDNGQVSTNTETISRTASSGDTSKLAFGDAPAGGRTASGLPPSTSTLGSSISVDPMLRHLAATALFQEVQLLNRYLKSAAFDSRYAAYVVRLQVSLMPRMRDEPYDAYSTIAFFPGPFQPNTGAGAPYTFADAKDPSEATVNGVNIIPLLVTDDIETAIESRSVDELRQLALALSAVVQGVGIGADLQKTDEKLRTVLGRDFNSTFTVARVSDNTLRCRFGALNQAKARYGMIPQTHNVTLLVLDPVRNSEAPDFTNRTIRVVAKTTLTDVETGKDLPGRTQKEVADSVRRILVAHGMQPDIESNEIRRLLYAVADNDYDSLYRTLQTMIERQKGVSPSNQQPTRKPPYPESIWVDLVSIRNGSQYSSATFSVPRKLAPQLKASAWRPAVPVLFDDGKSATVVKIRGGLGLDSERLAATLTVSNALTLGDTGIKVSGGGREVDITFPSLAAYKLTRDGRIEPRDLLLALHETAAGLPLIEPTQCQYMLAADPVQPQFAMVTRATLIEADKDSQGRLALVFSGKADKPGIFFAIKGADAEVESLPGGPTCTAKNEGWQVSGYGQVNLKLSNLDSISPVTITARDTTNNASAPPIVLPVVKQPSNKGE